MTSRKGALGKHSLGSIIPKLMMRLTDYAFDLRWAVDTVAAADLEDLTIDSEYKDIGAEYGATRVAYLRKLFRALAPSLPAESVLVDMGCGKGRVLLVASEFGFKEVRGVEFAEELCQIAEENFAAYKKRRSVSATFGVIESDAALYEIRSDENVFFLFNPFGYAVLRKVLENIETSLATHPRPIWVIYHHPVLSTLVEDQSYLTLAKAYDFWGTSFVVYTNMKDGSSTPD